MSNEGPDGGSSSASSPPVTGNNFDVFLSFRGETRSGFTDFLYTSLVGARVRTFRDEEELSDGESLAKQLPEAIKLSKIGIPILSEEYASSKWCLRELAEMVERQEDGMMIIMPVFFKISARDVKMKDGKGTYACGIEAHRGKGVEPALIEKWEKALEKVTSVKGREVSSDDRQGEFAKNMVLKVLKKLRKAKLNVSGKLVGMEEQLTELRRNLDTDSSDVRMIVISGIPGIGKTTLAKSLYNDICHLFDGCSFLGDVQETSEKKGHVALQNQLVSDIIRRDLAEFHSREQGIRFLKDRLSTLKVLILLDDVNDKKQLEALVGSLKWFGLGSRIIITTKDRQVLSGSEVTVFHEVTELTHDDALKLFCRYAFAKDFPEHDYVDLSRRIVSATGRLPLALELVGSLLSMYRDDKEFWKGLSEKLEELPDDNVQNKLKIPYEQLSKSQQHIFLDIACFLNGEDKRIASYMWEELKWKPKVEINMLGLKSMVKIGDDNRMWMHDQLRKLGRLTLKERGNYSRLWEPNQAWKIIQQDEDQMTVEALCLHMDNQSFTEQKDGDERSQACLTPDHFKRVPNLRFLIMDHSDIKGDFSGLLSELLWLRWHGCSRAFKAIKLSLKNLVILDLSWSKVTEGWEGWNHIESRKLKVLILRGCVDLMQTPDLSNFEALEMLVLEYCSHLVRIDPSIGQLKHLQIFDLKFCTDLSNLPRELDSLEKLRELRLDGTSIEDIPVSEDMKHLKTLSACNCKSLAQVSSEIGDIKSLEFLSMGGSELSALPDSTEKLEKLKLLSLRDCRLMWKLPDTIGRLTSLENLDLSSTGIDELPHAIGDMQKLKVLKMEGSFIREFPHSIGMLVSLEEIHASCCRSLETIPEEIKGLSRLRILVLSHSNIHSLPESISSLPNLQNLDLYGCEHLHEVPSLPSSLAALRLTYDSSKMKSFNISNLTNLKELYLANYLEEEASPSTDRDPRVQPLSLSGIGKLTKVETLKLCLSGFTALPEEMEDLLQLRKLDLQCPDLQCLPKLPKSLKKLTLQHCKSLKTLPELGYLKSLSGLELLSCAVMEIQGLGNLSSLEALFISHCDLVKLDSLERLTSLRILTISYCDSLRAPPDLPKQLIALKIQHCKNIPQKGSL